MTREEAIKMLRGMKADNLNLNDLYTRDKYEALVMAIKTLEQEPFINKPCVSIEACKYDKNKVLDRLSDEIKDTLYVDSAIFTALYDFKNGKIDVDEVIDKFNHETRIDVLKIIEELKKEELKKEINSIYGLESAQSKLTNGDVIKSIFPDIEVKTVKLGDQIVGYDISKLDKGSCAETYFTKSWWDAPYFVESEGK